jgi:DNA mismatch repair protein MutL
MLKIHQLSPEIVAKIAAGEVIERPIFAVKELIENSIDAGSDSISIYIDESGLSKIAVIDNGEGMSREDLEICFKPHTTSKISKIEELSHIQTLGFRGEALASIAAISRLTINSRVSTEVAGTQVVIKNGNVEKISTIGMPVGTVVTVEHLFYSLPVRKKFLKSPRTEFRQILDLVVGYALSYPHIHFLLTHNKKTILDLPITVDVLNRIEKLLGKEILSSIIPLKYSDSYVSISGFIAKPILTTSSPSKLYIFVNNRSVTDKGISSAVKAAYSTLLASNVYPVCILNISLPHEIVDVNVHPRKEIVRFANTNMLYTALKQAVNQALAQYDLTPDSSFSALLLSDATGSTGSYAGKLLKEKRLPWKLSKNIQTDLSQLLLLHNLYIIVITNTGFILLDQHAAHERVIYEQLLNEFLNEKERSNTFQFPKPGVFDLSLSESELLNEYLETFHDLGWEIEHFKNTTFVIRSLPVLFQDRDYVKLLREILEDLQNENHVKEIDYISKKMIAFLACRSAVKAGDKLSKKQAKELVEQLEKTPNNATCPHGRPTKVSIELDKIHRLFKRT